MKEKEYILTFRENEPPEKDNTKPCTYSGVTGRCVHRKTCSCYKYLTGVQDDVNACVYARELFIEQQLQLKDKMIELMAKDIIWLGSNKDKKSNGKQIDIVLSNYKQQALAELSNNEL